MRVHKTTLVPSLITLFVAFVLLVLWVAPVSRLSFPSISEPPCIPQGTSILECTCTAKGVLRVGFPFRTNLYDYCQQDENQDRRVVATNIAIDVLILVALYLLVRHRVSTKQL